MITLSDTIFPAECDMHDWKCMTIETKPHLRLLIRSYGPLEENSLESWKNPNFQSENWPGNSKSMRQLFLDCSCPSIIDFTQIGWTTDRFKHRMDKMSNKFRIPKESRKFLHPTQIFQINRQNQNEISSQIYDIINSNDSYTHILLIEYHQKSSNKNYKLKFGKYGQIVSMNAVACTANTQTNLPIVTQTPTTNKLRRKIM